MSMAGIENFAPSKSRGVVHSPRALTAAEREALRREWHARYEPITIGEAIHRARRRVVRCERSWLPNDLAAWTAAPWWALTWLLTFGRFGRLPWTWEKGPSRAAYRPLDPANPPRGGSGVPLLQQCTTPAPPPRPCVPCLGYETR